VFVLQGVSSRYVARFDEHRVEFVAQFVETCNINAGGFDTAGDFFASCDATYFRLARPDLLTGYTSHTLVSKIVSPFVSRLQPSAADVSDIAVLHYDLLGTGVKQTWMAGLAHADGFGRLVLMDTSSRIVYELAVSGFQYGNGWGTAWSYIDASGLDHLSFAANNGAGVFEVVLSSVDLSKSGKTSVGAVLKHSGHASTISGNNDGMFCKPSIHPYPCESQKQPLQILDDERVVSLDMLSGKFSTEWQLSRVATDPPFMNLNAADISPRDSRAYGVFSLKGDAFRILGRFDQDMVEFVASFPKVCNLNAGTFDSLGNFYAFCDGTFFRVARPDELIGYTALVSRLPEAEMFSAQTTLLVSDMASLNYDFRGTGKPQSWLVGLANAQGVGKLLLVSTDSFTAYEFAVSGFENGDGWGAAWNHRTSIDDVDDIFFSANNGAGVFKLRLDSIILSSNADALSCSLEHTGLASATSPNNDGMFCNPLIYVSDSEETQDGDTFAGNSGSGVPFWVFYVIIVAIAILLCCMFAALYIFYFNKREHFNEFELANTEQHIDEISELSILHGKCD